MRRIQIFAALTLAALLSGAAAAQVQLQMKAAAILPSGEIRLGDVATIAADNPDLIEALSGLSLGATPWPGNGRYVGRDHVLMHVGRAGYDVTQVRWLGTESCTVTVRTARVAGADIARAAREYLEALPMLQRDDVKIDVEQMPRDYLVAAGEAPRLEAGAAAVERAWGRVRMYVRILSGDRTLATVPVMMRVTSRQSVVVAVRPIGRNETIERGLVETREVVLGAQSDPDICLTRIEDVVGKKALRAVAAGTTLTAAMVTEPPAVRRGEGVSVVVRSTNMEILTKGVVQRDGAVGDVVPVKVLVSGKELSCRVSASGAVELLM